MDGRQVPARPRRRPGRDLQLDQPGSTSRPTRREHQAGDPRTSRVPRRASGLVRPGSSAAARVPRVGPRGRRSQATARALRHRIRYSLMGLVASPTRSALRSHTTSWDLAPVTRTIVPVQPQRDGPVGGGAWRRGRGVRLSRRCTSVFDHALLTVRRGRERRAWNEAAGGSAATQQSARRRVIGDIDMWHSLRNGGRWVGTPRQTPVTHAPLVLISLSFTRSSVRRTANPGPPSAESVGSAAAGAWAGEIR